MNGRNDHQSEFYQDLRALIDLILPASPDGNRPGALEVGVLESIEIDKDLSVVGRGFNLLARECQERYHKSFYQLEKDCQLEMLHMMRVPLRAFLIQISKKIFEVYYQSDRVLEAIGLGARAPFPEGYDVKEGDLTLLEEVYLRGRIYRDPDAEFTTPK